MSTLNLSNLSVPANGSASCLPPLVFSHYRTTLSEQEIRHSLKFWVYRKHISLRRYSGLHSESYHACSYSLENQVPQFRISSNSKSGISNSVKIPQRDQASCVSCGGPEEVHDDGTI